MGVDLYLNPPPDPPQKLWTSRATVKRFGWDPDEHALQLYDENSGQWRDFDGEFRAVFRRARF